MLPEPAAVSSATMPLPAEPVTLPDGETVMSPTPFWITAMPVAAPVTVPEVEIVTVAGAPVVPPAA